MRLFFAPYSPFAENAPAYEDEESCGALSTFNKNFERQGNCPYIQIKLVSPYCHMIQYHGELIQNNHTHKNIRKTKHRNIINANQPTP